MAYNNQSNFPRPEHCTSCSRCQSCTHYNSVYCTEAFADGRCRFCNGMGHMKKSCPEYAGFSNKSFIFNYLFDSPNTKRALPKGVKVPAVLELDLASSGAEKDLCAFFAGFEGEIIPHFQLHRHEKEFTCWTVEVKSGVKASDLGFKLAMKEIVTMKDRKVTVKWLD